MKKIMIISFLTVFCLGSLSLLGIDLSMDKLTAFKDVGANLYKTLPVLVDDIIKFPKLSKEESKKLLDGMDSLVAYKNSKAYLSLTPKEQKVALKRRWRSF